MQLLSFNLFLPFETDLIIRLNYKELCHFLVCSSLTWENNDGFDA